MSTLFAKAFPALRRLRTLAPHLGLTAPRPYAVVATKLVYSEYGDPVKVVRKEDDPVGDVSPDEVLVKMLAAPVNPADINTIQGK